MTLFCVSAMYILSRGKTLADAPEAIRAKRSARRPECFVFKAAVAGADANYWFHFLVSDQAEPGTLIVVHVFPERRPRDDD